MNDLKIKVSEERTPQSVRSPYSDLLFAIYEKALKEVREYASNTIEFEDAATFLLKDPYDALTPAMKNEICNIIEERMAERPPRGKGGHKK